jgi:hypothetical protein
MVRDGIIWLMTMVRCRVMVCTVLSTVNGGGYGRLYDFIPRWELLSLRDERAADIVDQRLALHKHHRRRICSFDGKET